MNITGNYKSERTGQILPSFAVRATNNISNGEDYMIATKTLNNDQIAHLPTAPIVVVLATETPNYTGFPTQIPIVLDVTMSIDTSGGEYSGGAGNDIYISLGDRDVTEAFVSSGAGELEVNSPKLLLRFSSNVINTNINNSLYDNSLVIWIAGGVDLGGGNIANSAEISVAYRIVDL